MNIEFNFDSNFVSSPKIEFCFFGTAISDGSVKTVNEIEPDENGNIEISIPSKTSQLTNDSNYIDENNAKLTEPAYIKLSDLVSNLSTGINKENFRVNFAFQILEAIISVKEAPTGSNIIVDINKNGATIFGTKLIIDDSELDSTTSSTPCTFVSDTFAIGDIFSVDLDSVGLVNTGKGLTLYLKIKKI